MASFYPLIKNLHMLFVFSWVFGMLALSFKLLRFGGQEEHFSANNVLLKKLINPSMILGFILGVVMIFLNPAVFKMGWFHAKLLLVFFFFGLHGVLAKSTRLNNDGQDVKPVKIKVILGLSALFGSSAYILASMKPF